MRLICLALSLIIISVVFAQEKPLALIPWPVEVKQQAGTYPLKNKITVSSDLPDHEWSGLLGYFKGEMKKLYDIDVSQASGGASADIRFEMRRMPTSGKPAYQLLVNKDGIVIRSNFAAPAFHAMQTFFQLIPLQGGRDIPFVEIFDHARFDYRGMHLDVSRHFFPVSFVKKYIDYLAYHKLNRFHWHLTDDQGWRIWIKKYPELTNTGSRRNGTIIGRYPGNGNDETPYGGFYTQEEIKEVIRYAKERFIEVIPEIEMPGHASAAIAAFPYLSCFPAQPTHIPANMISQKSISEQKNGRVKLVQETWGVFDDVFCAGNDSTFLFLQAVIDEVVPLFPSKYFHIGGDECPKTHWKKCRKCQQRMKEHGLKDEHELQSYFVQRIGKYLETKQKTLIGWDEILEGGLAPNAIVMSWRGEAGGIAAAKQKHEVIMTPGTPLYFDHTQSENEDSVTIGGYNPIEKVYAYDPIPKELSSEEGKYVLGAQANLWTEYIDNFKKVEYMIFPRMSALSEILWCPKESKDWNDFERRLGAQFLRYELWKSNYSKAFFNLKTTIEPVDNNAGVRFVLTNKFKMSLSSWYRKVHVHMPDTITLYDEKDISKVVGQKILHPGDSNLASICTTFENPNDIVIKDSSLIIVYVSEIVPAKGDPPRFIKTGNQISVQQKFYFNKATGKNITLKTPTSAKYPGDGAFTLVNGVQNEKGLGKSKEFLGFEGTDCEVIIDLGEKTDFKQVIVNTFTQTSSWIHPPRYASFTMSDDGITYRIPESHSADMQPYEGRKTRLSALGDKHFSARYIRIYIKNFGIIPEGNPGAGNPAWLFVDEIEIE